MTQGLRDYILETSNIEKQEFLAFGNVEVKIVNPLPENVSLAKVLHMISGLLPRAYYSDITKIQVGDHPKFADKEFNAMYQDGILYVSPEQDNEEDMIDDIIHETAHHLEVIALEEIYSDEKIKSEFLKRRRELRYELASEGYNVNEYDFDNLKYDEAFDNFLHKRVGYKTIKYLMQYSFVRPYGATSLREYFACAFQEYYLGNRDRLYRYNPAVYNKIDELHIEYSE
tara:strand:- start:494 stop:1177 length:684 start_codon:yes stop_codon:yes gene_type:complete